MTGPDKKISAKRSLLLRCLFYSLLLHGAGLFYLYKKPMTLAAVAIFSRSKASPTALYSSLDTKKTDELIAEILEEIIEERQMTEDTVDLAYEESPEPIASPLQEQGSSTEGAELTYAMESYLPAADDLLLFLDEPLSENIEIAVEPMPLAQDEFALLPEHRVLPSELALVTIPKEEEEESINIHENSLEPEALTASSLPAESGGMVSFTPYKGFSALSHPDIFGNFEDDQQGPLPPKENLASSAPALTYAPPKKKVIEELSKDEPVFVSKWDSFFDTKIALCPPQQDKGYIFSVTLHPKESLVVEKMMHNIYFLIDPSSSIDKHKFAVYKRAVLKALSTLGDSDRFNIIVLDKKLTRLSPKNILAGPSGQRMAEEFLDTISQASFLQSSELLHSIEKVVEMVTQDDQMHSALLLTSGKTSLSFKKQQKLLMEIQNKNRAGLCIYGAAVSAKNNLVALDMLCNLSGGKMLYCDTNASFPRKLAALTKSLNIPLAKEIKIFAKARSPRSGLELSSASSILPPLYKDEPYTIIGRLDRLCEVDITIEAKHHDEWVTIEKKINFQDVAVDPRLSKDFAQAEINKKYERFMAEPQASHLKEVDKILSIKHKVAKDP
jgi:hypothetical protein